MHYIDHLLMRTGWNRMVPTCLHETLTRDADSFVFSHRPACGIPFRLG